MKFGQKKKLWDRAIAPLGVGGGLASAHVFLLCLTLVFETLVASLETLVLLLSVTPHRPENNFVLSVYQTAKRETGTRYSKTTVLCMQSISISLAVCGLATRYCTLRLISHIRARGGERCSASLRSRKQALSSTVVLASRY